MLLNTTQYSVSSCTYKSHAFSVSTELFEWELEVYPKSVSMFGGTTVYFSGPCLLPSHNIRCVFSGKLVYGRALPDTDSKGMCISPMMDRAGWIDFCVSTNGGTDVDHCTKLFIGKCLQVIKCLYCLSTIGY